MRRPAPRPKGIMRADSRTRLPPRAGKTTTSTFDFCTDMMDERLAERHTRRRCEMAVHPRSRERGIVRRTAPHRHTLDATLKTAGAHRPGLQVDSPGIKLATNRHGRRPAKPDRAVLREMTKPQARALMGDRHENSRRRQTGGRNKVDESLTVRPLARLRRNVHHRLRKSQCRKSWDWWKIRRQGAWINLS